MSKIKKRERCVDFVQKNSDKLGRVYEEYVRARFLDYQQVDSLNIDTHLYQVNFFIRKIIMKYNETTNSNIDTLEMDLIATGARKELTYLLEDFSHCFYFGDKNSINEEVFIIGEVMSTESSLLAKLKKIKRDIIIFNGHAPIKKSKN